MTTPNETPQESNSTLTESMNECESSPSSSPSVSIPKRPFRMRRLGEYIFLVGISASLVGLGGFYERRQNTHDFSRGMNAVSQAESVENK